MKRPSRRLLLGAAAVAMVALAVLLVPWDAPPAAAEMEELAGLLRDAETEEARRWAAAPLAGAQAARDRLLRAVSGQARRPPLLRSYAAARSHLADATSHARSAAVEARRARAAAQADSAALLEEAATTLAAALQAADTARLRSQGRKALRRAAIAMDEARRNHQRTAYEQAAERAGEVLALSREWGGRAQNVLARLDSAESLAAWKRWIEETVAWSRGSGEAAIVVDKAERRLLLYERGLLVRTFRVELGRNPVADKLREGDDATPEGKYRITQVRGPGQTRFHRAFMLNYPSAEDWVRFKQAKREGRIPSRSSIGGLIEIHGHGGRGEDWTNGCVALSDTEMDYLAPRVREGTPVTIVGARRPHAQRAGERAAGSSR